MNILLSIFKKIPWWGWIAIVIAIFFLVNYISAKAMNRSLFNLALDQLREDKTAIVDRLKEDVEKGKEEKTQLKNQIATVQKQRDTAQAESQKLKGLVNEKNAEIAKLKKEREAIVVSGDPDSLINDLHKMGYKSARKRINPAATPR